VQDTRLQRLARKIVVKVVVDNIAGRQLDGLPRASTNTSKSVSIATAMTATATTRTKMLK
jgi:hypothetical protein